MISYIICCCRNHCIEEFLSMHGKRIPETAYDKVLCIFNLFTQRSILKCLLSLRSAGAIFSPIHVCPPPVEDISVLSCPSLVNVFGVSSLSCLFHLIHEIFLVKQSPPPCVNLLSLQPSVLFFTYGNVFFVFFKQPVLSPNCLFTAYCSLKEW